MELGGGLGLGSRFAATQLAGHGLQVFTEIITYFRMLEGVLDIGFQITQLRATVVTLAVELVGEHGLFLNHLADGVGELDLATGTAFGTRQKLEDSWREDVPPHNRKIRGGFFGLGLFDDTPDLAKAGTHWMRLDHTIAADFFLKQGSESYHLSIEYMFFVFTTLPMMGIFQVFMGAYQGAGRTNFSLILAVTRLWMMRVPLVLLFKDVFGLPQSGIWYAMVLSNFGAGFVGMTLYYFVDFRPKITQHFKHEVEDENEKIEFAT